MVSRLDLAGDGSEHGRHAACRAVAGFGPLQKPQAVFEHRNGRIAIPRVNISLVLAGEAPLRRFRVGIYETGVEEHRFGCLAVLAAIGPAANEFCSLPPRLGIGKVGLMAIIARH